MKHSLVMELIDLQHVSEDHELLVHDAGWDLLHAAGHFPQVGLPGGNRGVRRKPAAKFQETGISESVNMYQELMYI